MSLGNKIKEIRNRFGYSQDDLASLINVSRQAITKWENDNGIPDIVNLQELSKVFGVTVDSLLNDEELPLLVMRKELDRDKYGSKLSSYSEILKEYFSDYDIYVLTREKKMNAVEFIVDLVVGGSAPEMIYPIHTADVFSDLSPYYLVIKDNKKFLVNIKKWVLEVVELEEGINEKKFIYNGNIFRNGGKLKL